MGMIPNMVQAVYSCVITFPLFVALPFYAFYALVLTLSGRTPDYAKGIYGAVSWVERKRIYDPTKGSMPSVAGKEQGMVSKQDETAQKELPSQANSHATSPPQDEPR